MGRPLFFFNSAGADSCLLITLHQVNNAQLKMNNEQIKINN